MHESPLEAPQSSPQSQDTDTDTDTPTPSQESVSIPEEASAPMIEIHPAHHAATTLRDFFIHIATIALGLLLAVGLEQTVERVHHNRQVAEVREALRAERLLNASTFAAQTEEFFRLGPILQSNLDILQYIRRHPRSTPDQWPGRLRWTSLTFGYSESAWKTAEESTILQYMPRAEVAEYRDLYSRLERLNQAQFDETRARFQARGFALRNPDPAQLSPSELDREIEFTTQVILQQGISANAQRNLTLKFPDFKPAPTLEQVISFLRVEPDAGDSSAAEAVANRLRKQESADNGEGKH